MIAPRLAALLRLPGSHIPVLVSFFGKGVSGKGGLWGILCCLLLLVAGCDRPPSLDKVDLWRDEATWVTWRQGWARGVPLEGSRTVDVSGAGARLRAVAIPMTENATLRLEAGNHQTVRSFHQPIAIDFDPGAAESVTLSSPEGVYLLRPRLVDPDRQRRRILFMMADTLRFDHATAEGMPEIYRNFADGARFLRAYSPASWTLPSVASIFTGRLPAQLRAPDGTLISLPASASTLASELSDRGYTTVAITANYTVHHENRYSTGFDLFLVPDPKSGQFADVSWLRQLALEASGWLDDEDLFLYLQPMEVHDPYRNHETGEVLPAPSTGDTVTEGELDALRRAYASEAGYLSRELSRLRTELGAFDLEILTADHGEELFDHGGFRHGPALYPESVHVPLWVRGSGIDAGSVEQPVSLVGLKDALVAAAEDLLADAEPDDVVTALTSARPVTAETFSFGPPRWSLIDDDQQVIYFARRAGFAGAIDDPVEHSIEAWLLENQPRVLFSTLSGEPVDEPGRPLVDRSIRSLVDQFAGWRRGLYLLFQGDVGTGVEVDGVSSDGLIWGDADRIEMTPTETGGVHLEIDAPAPFILMFLPAKEAQEPVVELRRQPIQLSGSTPVRLADDGLMLWFDEGRPEQAAQEVEETLERLKALGYI